MLVNLIVLIAFAVLNTDINTTQLCYLSSVLFITPALMFLLAKLFNKEQELCEDKAIIEEATTQNLSEFSNNVVNNPIFTYYDMFFGLILFTSVIIIFISNPDFNIVERLMFHSKLPENLMNAKEAVNWQQNNLNSPSGVNSVFNQNAHIFNYKLNDLNVSSRICAFEDGRLVGLFTDQKGLMYALCKNN